MSIHDQQVDDAARRNASQMSDEKLRKELHLVSSFPEQPPVRVRYLAILAAEVARREAANSQGNPK